MMWTAIRDWYIAGIGLLLIAGGLALAAHQSSPPAAVNQAAGTAQGQAALSPGSADRTAQQAAPGATSGPAAPRATAAPAPAENPSASAATTSPAVPAAPQATVPSP